ncbi:MAG: hypothetical protein LUQ18_00350 [Methylococcaceae bacterium]|nr:hypothetical protein [Methylococcaceae bacterium]
MKKLILIAFISLLSTACTNDADGVPKITNTDNIIVDGKPMTAQAFYDAYCKLKPTNDTCIAVEIKTALKATQDRTVPRF